MIEKDIELPATITNASLAAAHAKEIA